MQARHIPHSFFSYLHHSGPAFSFVSSLVTSKGSLAKIVMVRSRLSLNPSPRRVNTLSFSARTYSPTSRDQAQTQLLPLMARVAHKRSKHAARSFPVHTPHPLCPTILIVDTPSLFHDQQLFSVTLLPSKRRRICVETHHPITNSGGPESIPMSKSSSIQPSDWRLHYRTPL